MKWVLLVVLGIAALAVIVAVVGAMLPEKHVATRRAIFKRSPPALWAAIERPKTFKEDGVNYQVVRSEPPRLLETRIADTNLPYSGSWVYEITPEGDGSSLRITENGEVHNVIFRFVSRYLMGHGASMEKGLRAIGEKLGEPVKIEE